MKFDQLPSQGNVLQEKITGSKKRYEVRQSFTILILKIVMLEVLLISIHILLQKLSFTFGWHEMFMQIPLASTIELIVFHLLNVIFLFFLLMNWSTTCYTIGPTEVTITTGILGTKKSSDDIRAMQELEIEQSILGRLFNYGSVRLGSPLWKRDVLFRNIPFPQKFSEIIEKYRAEAIAESPILNAFPKQS